MNAPVSRIALETVEIDNSDDPLWYRDAVIYQLNVKAFFDTVSYTHLTLPTSDLV